ncbi:MAG: hypothetical protein ABIK43_00075 [candidate division WOR-3 bacterium]
MNGEREDASSGQQHLAEPCLQELTSFSFATVQELISAARVLKDRGIEVIAAPRRLADCGVVLVLDDTQVPAALSLLRNSGIAPDSVDTYCPNGGT